MTVTVSSFRTTLPEFSNTTTYSDTSVQFWLDQMSKRMSVERWGELYDQGMVLGAAHYLTLAARRSRTAGAGGVPGMVSGPQTSKSVDRVSTSSDVGAVTRQGSGHWNLTEYGIMYDELVQLVGAGGAQL